MSEMQFKVLRKTTKGNLLLSPLEEADASKLENKHLFYQGKKAAVVSDVIASVQKPLVLAKPSVEVPAEGILESKR